MACQGCGRRKRKLLAGTGQLLAAFGRTIPRVSLLAMVDVQCISCGYTGDGTTFRWQEEPPRGVCPRCGRTKLVPGVARD